MQIGNWTRWLTDLFGMGAGDSIKDDQNICEDDGQGGADEPKCFYLLSALSDLLMLPKDMLMDRTIRMEVHVLFILMNSTCYLLFYFRWTS